VLRERRRNVRTASLSAGSGETEALRIAIEPLTWAEQAHLNLRLRSVPWTRVVQFFEPSGSLVDIGCGFGLLAYLLSKAGFRGTYLGLDPDPRKVARARRWLPEPEERKFRVGTVDDAPAGAFTQAALIDVLYLVPKEDRPGFLERAVRSLEPGGLLVALTSGGGPRWKRRLDAAQERLAVGLGITRGGAVAPCDGAEVAQLLTAAGLTGATVVDLGRDFVHGFELVTARKPRA
jgi:SAM-dependent methyltransferase